jgi:membrane protein DedA with SNARE-associated domain
VVTALISAGLHHHVHGPSVDYVGLGLAAFAGWVGVPGPGEAALVAAGVLASRGRLDLAEVVVVAFAGATAGGVAGWLLGLKFGRAMIAAPGPLRHVRERALASGERFYHRFGVVAVLFTPSWMAGIHRMDALPYLTANAVSALLWAPFVGVGAYLIGNQIEDIVSDVGLAGLAVVAAVAAAATLLERRRRRRRAIGPRG